MFTQKEKIGEIFFYVFNKLVQMNKTIVINSDRSFEHLKIDPRVTSRLGSGMSVTIFHPETNAIKEIIKNKLAQHQEQFKLTDDALGYFANRSDGDIRKLTGMLTKVVYNAKNEYPVGTLLTVKDLQQIFEASTETTATIYGITMNPKIIVESICIFYNADFNAVISEARHQPLVYVRNICMYILRKKFKMKLTAIGSVFSNRSHPTVKDAIEKAEKLIKNDEEISTQIHSLMSRL
jgi:chromosomal replication initiator protein